MDYEATQPINLPIADFLELEFHLMDTRPGARTEAFVAELVKRWLRIESERLAPSVTIVVASSDLEF